MIESLQIEEPAQAAVKHSGLGIASFVMAVVVLVLTCAIVVVAGVMESSTPGGMEEQSSSIILVGFAIIAMLIANVIAFGLGVGGIFQKNRRRLYAVLGMCFSMCTFLGTIALILFGLSLQAAS